MLIALLLALVVLLGFCCRSLLRIESIFHGFELREHLAFTVEQIASLRGEMADANNASIRARQEFEQRWKTEEGFRFPESQRGDCDARASVEMTLSNNIRTGDWARSVRNMTSPSRPAGKPTLVTEHASADGSWARNRQQPLPVL